MDTPTVWYAHKKNRQKSVLQRSKYHDFWSLDWQCYKKRAETISRSKENESATVLIIDQLFNLWTSMDIGMLVGQMTFEVVTSDSGKLQWAFFNILWVFY